jgi:dolichol-phosphate mannosyltransferase
MSYSLIIPIFNEDRTLKKLLNKLDRISQKIEVIIVDDGSTDKTKKILQTHSKSKIIIIINEINRGKGFAIRAGVKKASKENIILFDGDLELNIEEIPKLITCYENFKCDALVGNRWGINNNSIFNFNIFGNQLVNYLFNILFSSKYNDVLCCAKILEKKLFKNLEIKSNGFSFEIETMAKLAKKKLKIKEINIRYNRRTINEGKKIKTSHIWIILFTMFKVKLLFKPFVIRKP